MSKRKGLGRGLDALLAGTNSDDIHDVIEGVHSSDIAEDEQLKKIPLEMIQRGSYQPRRHFDTESLQELSVSIKAQGVMQPIVVRPINAKDKRYEIIAGERRWRASQLAGMESIPAIIRHVPDEAAIAMALIENIQRENLNPLEEAMALKRLQDEFDLTHQDIAKAVGKSRTTVTNLLRLTGLDNEVKRLLENGDIEMGHARSVLSLDNINQRKVANEVIAKSLSVRQAEMLVRRLQEQKDKLKVTEEVSKAPELYRLEEGLSEKLGVPVVIHNNAKGKGKLILKYNSLDELDGILAHMSYTQDD